MKFSASLGLRVSGIYKILNTENGKCYVGSSVNVEGRIFKHLSFLRRGLHNNAHLQAAFARDGEAAFEYSLVESCESDALLECEQRHIDTTQPEYNICQVAGNTLGYRHTEAGRAKMAIANKGNTNRVGKAHTQDTKALIGSLAAQRTHRDEAKAKIARASIGNRSNTGRTLPPEHVAKVAAASLLMWNGEDKDERRRAAADRAKARWADPQWKAQQGAKIKAGKAARRNDQTTQLAG